MKLKAAFFDSKKNKQILSQPHHEKKKRERTQMKSEMTKETLQLMPQKYNRS